MDDKGRMRNEARMHREALPAAEVDRLTAAIADRFFQSRLVAPGDLIMGYLSFRNEVRAESILLRAIAKGSRVALPYADIDGRRLVPYLIADFSVQIATSRYGMPEPDPARCEPAPIQEIALILVPGLAFDRDGRRLGYGGGFYDRFIAEFQAKGLLVPTLVGLAFETQLVERVPAQAHDAAVDYVLTESRLIKTSARPC